MLVHNTKVKSGVFICLSGEMVDSLGEIISKPIALSSIGSNPVRDTNLTNMKTKQLYVSNDIDADSPAVMSYIYHTISKLAVDGIKVNHSQIIPVEETDEHLTDSLFIYKEGFRLKHRVK